MALYRDIQTQHLARTLGYWPESSGTALIAVWGERIFALFRGRASALRAQVMFLPYVRGGVVLDVGCGNGEKMTALQRAGWKVCGIETDSDAAAAAQGYGLDVTFESIESFARFDFDAIVLSHVIEHVLEPRVFTEELARRLRPGGRVVIVTPNQTSMLLRYFGSGWRGLEAPRHIFIYTSGALTKLLRDAGLEVETCERPVTSAGHNLDGSRPRGDWTDGVPRRLKLFVHAVLLSAGLGGEELVVMARKPLQTLGVECIVGKE